MHNRQGYLATAAAFLCLILALAIPRTAAAAPTPVLGSSVRLVRSFPASGNTLGPNNMTLDPQGNLWVSLEGYDVPVVKMSPDGTILSTWHIPNPENYGEPQDAGPIAFDSQGNVLVLWTFRAGANATWDYVTKFSPTGEQIWSHMVDVGWGHVRIALDGSDNIYIMASGFDGCLDRFTPDMSSHETVAQDGVDGLFGADDGVYYSQDGVIWHGTSWQNKTMVLANVDLSNDLTADGYGNYYSFHGSWVDRTDAAGNTTVYAEGFEYIRGIAADSVGRVYVANIGPDGMSGGIYVIEPPLPDAASSTIAVDKTSITTDETATVTVTMKNINGMPWKDRQVSLTATGANAVVTPVNSGLTNAAGVATFVVSNPVVESGVRFTATDVADGVTVNQTVDVSFSVGRAAKLVWSGQPGSGVAGQPLTAQPVLQLQDAHGNLKTDDGSTVLTLTASDGAVLTGNTVTVNAGVATFTGVQTTKAGTFTLTAASDGGLTSPASLGFTVSPGALAKLTWHTLPPNTGTQGLSFTVYPAIPELYLQDQYDNLLANDSSTRVLMIASDGEVLGNALATAADGVVRFPGLLSENYGTFTLRAVAFPQIYSAPSNQVVISPAANAPTISALAPGAKVVFAGRTWVVVDSGQGCLMLQEPLDVWAGDTRPPLYMNFSTGLNPVFDPLNSENVAHYLNSDFYSSLPYASQGWIRNHTWTTGPNDGQGNNRETMSSVTCKVGLISYSEFLRYRDAIAGISDHYWTRTPVRPNDYYAWTIWSDNSILGDYDFSTSNVVRPVIYVEPNLTLDGDLVGFRTADLMEYPQAATVSNGVTTIATAPNTDGNTLAVVFSPSVIPAPYFGSQVPAGSAYPYAPGSQIAANPGDFMGVYELNSDQKVVAFAMGRVPTGILDVKMSPLSADLVVGGYQQLRLTYWPLGTPVTGATWSSAGSDAVSVSPTGLVTARGVGEATVTGRSPDGFSATCVVRVTAAPAPATLTGNNSDVTVYGSQPVRITIPETVADAATLSTVPAIIGDRATSILPEVTATTTTSQGDMELSIPSATQISGPTSWNGEISLPHVINNPAIPSGQVDIALEIGLGDTPLRLSQPIRIVFRGQARTPDGQHRYAGWTQNGVFHAMPFMGTDPANDNAGAAIGHDGDGFLILGNDLVVWTRHLTTFVAFVPAPPPVDDPQPPVEPPEQPPVPAFPDVPATHWCSGPIGLLRAKGIIAGYPDGTFRPDAGITRAEFVAVLVKTLGLTAPGTVSTFADVAPGDWFYGPVTAAARAGLVLGVGEGRFAPNALISREEMAAIIARALGNRAPAGDGTELTSFVDRESLSDWAIPGMAAAVRAGIVGGDDLHRLAPQANATRAEAVAMVQRMLTVLDK